MPPLAERGAETRGIERDEEDADEFGVEGLGLDGEAGLPVGEAGVGRDG